MANDLRVLQNVADGLITPFPTLVPVDVQRYHDASAARGGDFTNWHTSPNVSLPVLVTLDPLAVIDVGREFYQAGYTNDLPVADVDMQLAMEAARISASSRG